MSLRIRNFGIAVATTGLAWLVDILLQEKFSESSVALYFAAALVTTWVGGLGPGLAAIGLTVAVNLVFFDHPYHAPFSHVLGIDFVREADGAAERVAVELTADSARALVKSIMAALEIGEAAHS